MSRPSIKIIAHLTRAAAIAAVATGAMLVASCGDDDGAATPEVDQTVTSGIAREADREGRCQAVPAVQPRKGSLDRPADLTPEPGSITFETSCGAFTVELAVDDQPKTTASVEYLVSEGFYDGLAFHRVVPDFLIQGGDPRGSGTGGPGYFVDEPPADGVSYPKWTVVMAKTRQDPAGRSGSQFYVVLSDDAEISPSQAVLGEVVAGFKAVERIGLIGPPASEGPPVIPVRIEKATFYPAG